MHCFATNLRRVMARRGMTIRDVIEATRLHERTIKGVLNGRNKPHARTIYRLAEGLGVSVDEFFRIDPLAEHDKELLDVLRRALESEYRDMLLGTLEMIRDRMNRSAS